MTAAATQQPPSVPPRPAKGQEQERPSSTTPKIPPRPTRRPDRSVSPNPDRFAPSPLHAGIPSKPTAANRFGPSNALSPNGPIERSGGVSMPSVGEEGAEYSAVTHELEEDKLGRQESPPEQTRTVGEDMHIHAPKPTMSAQTAKRQVMAVTRTDSDKAASFGIGRSGEERAKSRDRQTKRSSTAYSTTSEGQITEDETGIPELGQRVPMNPNLGDVQAPSPGPGSEELQRHHQRKHSARGGPPGSYGLHGHGIHPQDKLEKEYYQKHPDLLQKEFHHPLHERQKDYAMSSEDLNKLVRDTASRGSGLGTSSEYQATPTDEVAFHAHEEYARSRPGSVAPSKSNRHSFVAEITSPDGDQTFHVDDAKHPEYRSYGDGDNIGEDDDNYKAPILAPDEVRKDSNEHAHHPAVRPALERRGSAFEMDETTSRPNSRPNSRPTSLYRTNSSQYNFEAKPLEDVKEYEPLFSDEAKKEKPKVETADENKEKHHFPSKDVWEDAPSSVHYTAEVSTPEAPEQHRRKSSNHERSETPAQAFARHQEELAERDVTGSADTFMPPRACERPTWADRQSHLKKETKSSSPRFPSRDVWEDTPESLLHETTVSTPQTEEDKSEEFKPSVPSRPVKKSSESSERPAIPQRPKPVQSPSPSAEAQKAQSSEEEAQPQVPARPSKSSSDDNNDGEETKSKPALPARAVGGKIAALQAGFMSDLNKRLKLGPQAPKKEEAQPEETPEEEKKPAPLSDARKGRARGPQRRAPAKAAAPAATTSTSTASVLSFSLPSTFWSIDPHNGDLSVSEERDSKPAATPEPVQLEEPESTEAEKQEPFDQPPKQAIVDPIPLVEEDAGVSSTQEPPQQAEEAEQPKAEEEQEPIKEERTFVSNMAGESILEATVEKRDEGNDVEPVQVDDKPKE